MKKPETLADRGWIPLKTATGVLGVSIRTLNYWVKRNEIESKKIGKTRWVRLPKEMREP